MTVISLRDYVVPGLVSVEVVNALIAFGEPMLTEDLCDYAGVEVASRSYRAWVRLRSGGRTFGQPDMSPQLAAENLLRKMEGRR